MQCAIKANAIEMEQVPGKVVSKIMLAKNTRPNTASVWHLNEQMAIWTERSGEHLKQSQRFRMMFQHVAQEDGIVLAWARVPSSIRLINDICSQVNQARWRGIVKVHRRHINLALTAATHTEQASHERAITAAVIECRERRVLHCRRRAELSIEVAVDNMIAQSLRKTVHTGKIGGTALLIQLGQLLFKRAWIRDANSAAETFIDAVDARMRFVIRRDKQSTQALTAADRAMIQRLGLQHQLTLAVNDAPNGEIASSACKAMRWSR